jgi:lysophospholipase L1-like esterase
MKELNRVKVGKFDIGQSITIEELENNIADMKFINEHFISIEKAFLEKKSVIITQNRMKHFINGVKLSFKTNSENLFLSFEIERPASRKYYSVDVFVDGKIVGCIDNFSGMPMPENYTEIPFPSGNPEKEFYLGEGEKTVTVHLPWASKTMIRKISVDDGACVEELKPAKKLLVYGDSITQGYDALRPSNRYIARLAEALGAEEYNKAIGGEVFCPALGKIKNDIEPDYITVAYGTNDFLAVKEEDFYENCRGFYRAVSENYPNAKIFAITPIWRAEIGNYIRFDDFPRIERDIREATKDLANVTVIRGYDFVPHKESLYADLYLHPNEEGFEHYAKNIIKEIKDAL